jgi:hypothetical protein
MDQIGQTSQINQTSQQVKSVAVQSGGQISKRVKSVNDTFFSVFHVTHLTAL